MRGPRNLGENELLFEPPCKPTPSFQRASGIHQGTGQRMLHRYAGTVREETHLSLSADLGGGENLA